MLSIAKHLARFVANVVVAVPHKILRCALYDQLKCVLV